MIYAMAYAEETFDRKEYGDAAEKCAHFLKSAMWKNGHLLRRYREQESKFSAGLGGYAYLMKGLLGLFQTGRGADFLEWA